MRQKVSVFKVGPKGSFLCLYEGDEMSKSWFRVIDIIEFEVDIVDAVEVGDLVVAKCEDGFWSAERYGSDIESIEWRKATSTLISAYKRAFESAEETLSRLDESDQTDRALSKDRSLYHDHQEVVMMTEYTGTSDAYIDEYFKHSFEPRFGSDFSL